MSALEEARRRVRAAHKTRDRIVALRRRVSGTSADARLAAAELRKLPTQTDLDRQLRGLEAQEMEQSFLAGVDSPQASGLGSSFPRARPLARQTDSERGEPAQNPTSGVASSRPGPGAVALVDRTFLEKRLRDFMS